MSEDRQAMKRALLVAIIRASADDTILDEEDQEKLVEYKMGHITHEEWTAYCEKKARRVEEQIRRPQ